MKKRDRRWRIIYLKQYVKNNETDIRGYMRPDATRRGMTMQGKGAADSTKQIVAWILRHGRRTDETEKEWRRDRERKRECVGMCMQTLRDESIFGVPIVERPRTLTLREYISGIKWNINVNFIDKKIREKKKRERYIYRKEGEGITRKCVRSTWTLHN